MNNAAWNVEDMTMLLFAMYRVLLQSRPDAPNELMIQIPITCSTLLPSLLKLYVRCNDSERIDPLSVTKWECGQRGHEASRTSITTTETSS